jgi:hypothetical protein
MASLLREYIEKDRELSNTHKKIIKAIKNKLGEVE